MRWMTNSAPTRTDFHTTRSRPLRDRHRRRHHGLAPLTGERSRRSTASSSAAGAPQQLNPHRRVAPLIGYSLIITASLSCGGWPDWRPCRYRNPPAWLWIMCSAAAVFAPQRGSACPVMPAAPTPGRSLSAHQVLARSAQRAPAGPADHPHVPNGHSQLRSRSRKLTPRRSQGVSESPRHATGRWYGLIAVR
jgi:hypothetical protein